MISGCVLVIVVVVVVVVVSALLSAFCDLPLFLSFFAGLSNKAATSSIDGISGGVVVVVDVVEVVGGVMISLSFLTLREMRPILSSQSRGSIPRNFERMST